MGVKLVSSSGGSVELVAPTTASNFTMTVPANSGTVITTASTFAGTGPAFFAYQDNAQSFSTATTTKVNFQAEVFDTNNTFSGSTFTPNVAGYYQLSSGIRCPSGFTNGHILIYKNGGEYLRIFNMDTTNQMTGSGLVYANGSTDYFEIYLYHASGVSRTASAAQAQTYFQGVLVRDA